MVTEPGSQWVSIWNANVLMFGAEEPMEPSYQIMEEKIKYLETTHWNSGSCWPAAFLAGKGPGQVEACGVV